MSMFEKIGQSGKLQQSPGQLIDFHNNSGKGAGHHLKPMSKMGGSSHNQSFDAIPMHSKLVSHSGQHGSKLPVRGVDSKLISSGQHSIKGGLLAGPG